MTILEFQPCDLPRDKSTAAVCSQPERDAQRHDHQQSHNGGEPERDPSTPGCGLPGRFTLGRAGCAHVLRVRHQKACPIET